MSLYLLMDGMKRCIVEKKTHGSDALRIWLWDHDKIWNGTLFQVINKLNGMMHKTSYLGIPWSDILILMEFDSSSMQHD